VARGHRRGLSRAESTVSLRPLFLNVTMPFRQAAVVRLYAMKTYSIPAARDVRLLFRFAQLIADPDATYAKAAGRLHVYATPTCRSDAGTDSEDT
jgi:hypothetical protein